MDNSIVYLVKITKKKSKTEDHRDVVNYGKIIEMPVGYYAGRGELNKLITSLQTHDAAYMTERYANEVAQQLRSELPTDHTVTVIDYAPNNPDAIVLDTPVSKPVSASKVVNPEFKVHRLNEQGLGKAQELAEHFDSLLTYLQSELPNGRYLSLVKTNLETACFYAKKGIAEKPENQI